MVYVAWSYEMHENQILVCHSDFVQNSNFSQMTNSNLSAL